jgi:hypothetical protein
MEKIGGRSSSQFGYQQAIDSGNYKTNGKMLKMIGEAVNSRDRDTRSLAKHTIASGSISIRAQMHSGGLGRAGETPDSRPHYTVVVEGRKNVTLHVYTKVIQGKEVVSKIGV